MLLGAAFFAGVLWLARPSLVACACACRELALVWDYKGKADGSKEKAMAELDKSVASK